MEGAEQQYQRDVARLGAHRLALKDDEFHRVSELVRQEAREHTRYVQQRDASIVLNDRGMRRAIYISSAVGQKVATITFNPVRHEIAIKTTGTSTPVNYLFQADVTLTGDRPIVVGFRGSAEPLGLVSDDLVFQAVRSAINALTS